MVVYVRKQSGLEELMQFLISIPPLNQLWRGREEEVEDQGTEFNGCLCQEIVWIGGIEMQFLLSISPLNQLWRGREEEVEEQGTEFNGCLCQEIVWIVRADKEFLIFIPPLY